MPTEISWTGFFLHLCIITPPLVYLYIITVPPCSTIHIYNKHTEFPRCCNSSNREPISLISTFLYGHVSVLSSFPRHPRQVSPWNHAEDGAGTAEYSQPLLYFSCSLFTGCRMAIFSTWYIWGQVDLGLQDSVPIPQRRRKWQSQIFEASFIGLQMSWACTTTSVRVESVKWVLGRLKQMREKNRPKAKL